MAPECVTPPIQGSSKFYDFIHKDIILPSLPSQNLRPHSGYLLAIPDFHSLQLPAPTDYSCDQRRHWAKETGQRTADEVKTVSVAAEWASQLTSLILLIGVKYT